MFTRCRAARGLAPRPPGCYAERVRRPLLIRPFSRCDFWRAFLCNCWGNLRRCALPPIAFLSIGLGLLLGLPLAAAQTISYTVQVAALSDQASAEGLRRTLSEAGYPAYLVSVPGGAGTVYRLRVGAFADRDGAQAFAAAMRGVGGTVPVPALAEGIPPNLIPLEPRVVARYRVSESGRLEVVPWGDAAALRVQGRLEGEPLVASYRVLTPELVASPFAAWRAAPLPGISSGALPDEQNAEENTVQRVTNLPLYTAEEATALPADGSLTETGRARLLEAAEALGLSEAQVRPYVFSEPGRGAPFLVVAERFDPVSRTGGRYPALGNPVVGNPGTARIGVAGPDLTWFGQAAPEAFPEELPDPLFSLSTPPRQDEPTGNLAGAGWSAVRDGSYTALTAGKRRWRAVVGRPLWAGGDFLLVYMGEEAILYEVTPPAR